MDLDEKTMQNDHDLLISLNTKVDHITLDLKRVGDGMSTQLAKHEARLNAIDEFHARLNPDEQVRRIDELTDAYQKFQNTKGYLIGVSAGIGAVVGIVSMFLANVMEVL